ncbi:DMT family transporter [Haliea alexandrii]|uniref:hypothetical protein n=1 Tax=Haliea alexandrii TaxID=2448162 RepID=UPI0038CC12DF
MGAALIAVFGSLYFKEPLSALKVFSVILVIAGVIGFNLSGAQHWCSTAGLSTSWFWPRSSE